MDSMLSTFSKLCRCALVAILALILTSSAFGVDRVRRVDVSATTSGDGQSWATPYKYLFDAIAELAGVMGSGDTGEIRVAGGVYYPDRSNANLTGTGSKSAHFKLLRNVKLLGHFKGLSSSGHEDERDPAIISYLDGDIDTDNSLDSDNSYHVVFADDAEIEVDHTWLDGFTIRNGYAHGSTDDDKNGAGALLLGAHPKVRDCVFENNDAQYSGGGIMFDEPAAAPEVRN